MSTPVDGGARAVLFIDYENARRAASDLFFDKNSDAGHFHPRKLAAVICDRYNQNERPPGTPDLEITEVRVYRGIPDRKRDNPGYLDRIYREQAWIDLPEHTRLQDRGPKVEVIGSLLQYPDPDIPRPSERERANVVEKEVDTAIAADLVAMALDGQFDVAIMFSEDRDMRPPMCAVLDRDTSGKTIPVHRVGWGFDRDERIVDIPETDLPDDAYSPEYPLWLHHYEACIDDTNYLQLACQGYRPGDILTVEVADRNRAGLVVVVDEHVLGFVFWNQLVSIDSGRNQPATQLEGRSNRELTVAIKRIVDDPSRLGRGDLPVVLSERTVRIDELQRRHNAGEVFDGRVTDSNEGGLLVSVEGVKTFMPLSQIVGITGDHEQRIAQLAEYKGRSLRLEVIEIDRGRNQVTVSERVAQGGSRSRAGTNQDTRRTDTGEVQAAKARTNQRTDSYEYKDFVPAKVKRFLTGTVKVQTVHGHEGDVADDNLADGKKLSEVVAEGDILPLVVSVERSAPRLSLKLVEERSPERRKAKDDGWKFNTDGSAVPPADVAEQFQDQHD